MVGFYAEGNNLVDWKTHKIVRLIAQNTWQIFGDLDHFSHLFKDVYEDNSCLIIEKSLFDLFLVP